MPLDSTSSQTHTTLMTTAQMNKSTDLSQVDSRNLSDMYAVVRSTIACREKSNSSTAKEFAKLFRIEGELKSRGLL